MKNDTNDTKYMEEDCNVYVKESICSYSRPIDETTRLIVYNSSNITGLECIDYLADKVVVEVFNGCMIVFTTDTFHVGVNIYEHQSGVYSSHLRLFAFIVENNHVSIKD